MEEFDSLTSGDRDQTMTSTFFASQSVMSAITRHFIKVAWSAAGGGKEEEEARSRRLDDDFLYVESSNHWFVPAQAFSARFSF